MPSKIKKKQSSGPMDKGSESFRDPAPASEGFFEGKKTSWIALGLMALLGFLIYSNTWHAEFQLDDAQQITSNLSLHGTLDIPRIWASNTKTRFLAFLTFALNFQWHRDNVVGYHIFNLGIHVLNAFWVYFLAVALLGAPKAKGIFPQNVTHLLAIFTALFFLVHPLQTAAVTYVVQRMASMAAFFYLGAIVLYLKFRLSSDKACYAMALGMAFAAMFCKENAVTLPLAIIMTDLLFFEQKEKKHKILLRWTPFLITPLPDLYFSGVLPAISHWFNAGKGGSSLTAILPADTTEGVLSRGKYLLTQLNVLCTYLRLLIFPVNQNLDYDYPVAGSFFEVKTLASFLFLAGLLGAAILWIKKNRLLSFGIFWFFLTLSVESGFIPIADVIFEHRMYLPMAGCALFFCVGLYEFLKDRKQWIVTVALALCVLSFLTHARNEVWKTRISMWQDVVKKSGKKARAFNNLGDSYLHLGQYAEALPYLQKANDLDPDYAPAYYNRGYAWANLGDPKNAKEFYLRAIEKGSHFGLTYNNLGILLVKEGDLKGALEKFQTATKEAPDNFAAYDNLGLIYDYMQDPERAGQNYQKAIRINPDYPNAYYHLGLLRVSQGDRKAAIAEMEKAVEKDPEYAEAWFGLGKNYITMKDTQRAAWVEERLMAISRPELAKELREMLQNGIPEKKTGSSKKICNKGFASCEPEKP